MKKKKDIQFLVTWEMDIWASSPKQAAKKALAVHRNPDSIATVFNVGYHKETVTKSGKKKSKYVNKQIDLQE